MTIADTLPGMDALPSAPSTDQWRLEQLQVCNWGGFAGPHTLAADKFSTMLSGQSGTGKSSLLDAYLALLMPAKTPFNGASNDTGGGAARGETQRSLLSYTRGQVETTSDGRDGKAELLRGDGVATWSAIVGRFVSVTGRRFTVARMYYVPPSATRDADIVKRMATYDGVVDVADLAPLAADRFSARDLKAAFPGVESHNAPGPFASTFCSRLGIGAAGDGTKALALLANIQAGGNFPTVDRLYKSMVLEEPATFKAADLALAHFDELDDLYTEMADEQAKAAILEPLSGHVAAMGDAADALDELVAIGVDATGPSPLRAWEAAKEGDLVAAAEHAAKVELDATKDALADARDAEMAAHDARARAEAAYTAGGGARLTQIDRELSNVAVERHSRGERLARLDGATSTLRLAPGALADRPQFESLTTRARAAVDQHDEQVKAIDAKQGPLAGTLSTTTAGIRALEAEIAAAKNRKGRVPGDLDYQRMAVCEATGLTRDDLPFLAELLDVRPGEQQWRTAIEVTLAASGRMMLVPADKMGQVSAAVDAMRWTRRMRFEPARQHLPRSPRPDSGTVAGKVDVVDGPFAGWVSEHIAHPSRDALCVPDASGLPGGGRRVTAAGQTRFGSTHAHGRNANERDIIGSDNQALLDSLATDKAVAQADLESARAQYDALSEQLKRLQLERDGHIAILNAAFVDVDVAGCDARAAALGAERGALLAADADLAALKAVLDAAERSLTAATKHVGVLEKQEEALDKRWKDMVDRADTLARVVEGVDLAEVNDAVVARLDALWAAVSTARSRDDLADWKDNRDALRRALRTEAVKAGDAHAKAADAIEAVIAAYQDAYFDPDLGLTVEAAGDYVRVREQIVATGLSQRIAQWREKFLEWSGEDLVPLTQAMANAVPDINSRLLPVNDVLATLPFGPTSGRLKIEVRHAPPRDVQEFRAALVQLSSDATRDMEPGRLDARFAQLRSFMALLRSEKDPRLDKNVANRAKLLDVRDHVSIWASVRNHDDKVIATYNHLGHKSGGETQELVAFILGSALRFRLGDQLRDRPRFAPVLLDEAFIKADAEFSGRAVRAWTALGFQLVVGAPTDKVTALEPHMRALVSITKDHATHCSYIVPMSDAGCRGWHRTDDGTLS